MIEEHHEDENGDGVSDQVLQISVKQGRKNGPFQSGRYEWDDCTPTVLKKTEILQQETEPHHQDHGKGVNEGIRRNLVFEHEHVFSNRTPNPFLSNFGLNRFSAADFQDKMYVIFFV
jgi:hypothetical protein